MLEMGTATRALNVKRLKAGDVGVIRTRLRCRSAVLRHAAARAGTLPRAALLAGVSCAALAALSGAVYAVDGTWTGLGTEWTDGDNWSSSPDVPDDTATFTNNSAPTSVTISSGADINTILFTAAAPAYLFTNSDAFGINGAGIVNNSTFAPTFTNTGDFSFNNASSAGNAIIINNGRRGVVQQRQHRR